MGAIVFWTLVRAAVLIPALIILHDYVDYQFYWIIGIAAVYGVIIHPAVVQYNLFREKNKDVIDNSLCASCKHFDESAVLCMKHDKHPTMDFIPCEGMHWELKEGYYEKQAD